MSETGVAIVGGGPSGLMLAIELGCRGIDCVVFDENTKAPQLPKANATASRTMEHYRRRGFADRIRALGLPPDHPQDIVYTTKLAHYELSRFRIPSSSELSAQSTFGDYTEAAWPTPELPHRVQQMFVEPVLKAEAMRYPSVRLCSGYRVAAVQARQDGVRVEAQNVTDGSTTAYDAYYAVGCDGSRSVVRRAMGAGYSGRDATREFMGGQMLSIFFTSPDLYDVLGKERAWQYWAVNPVQRAVMCAVNGRDSFVFLVQVNKGRTADEITPEAVFRDAIGAEFRYEIVARTPWHAGLALVADVFRSGRLLIAGDAAHLFTPTAGMGYNTSIDDVVNLGWKLAAVLQGWAPEKLLDSYEAERRPIAFRNTAFAASMADSLVRFPVTAAVEESGVGGDAARELLGQATANHVAREFNIPGLQLGVRYGGAIVAEEDGVPPPDEPDRYAPSGYPGARAPHVWVGAASLHDLFGRDFTLLLFGQASAEPWEQAARQSGLPLSVVRSQDARARELYGADAILIRPDHHVAWRGDPSHEAGPVLARSVGRGVTGAS